MDARCAVVVAVLIASTQRQVRVNQQTSTSNRINASLAIVLGGGGGHGEPPTCKTCLLIAVYGFVVGVISFGVVVFLRDVVDDFVIDDSDDSALVLLANLKETREVK